MWRHRHFHLLRLYEDKLRYALSTIGVLKPVLPPNVLGSFVTGNFALATKFLRYASESQGLPSRGTLTGVTRWLVGMDTSGCGKAVAKRPAHLWWGLHEPFLHEPYAPLGSGGAEDRCRLPLQPRATHVSMGCVIRSQPFVIPANHLSSRLSAVALAKAEAVGEGSRVAT